MADNRARIDMIDQNMQKGQALLEKYGIAVKDLENEINGLKDRLRALPYGQPGEQEIRLQIIELEDKLDTVLSSTRDAEINMRDLSAQKQCLSGKITMNQWRYENAKINKDRDESRLEEDISSFTIEIKKLEAMQNIARANGDVEKEDELREKIKGLREYIQDTKAQLADISEKGNRKVENAKSVADAEQRHNMEARKVNGNTVYSMDTPNGNQRMIKDGDIIYGRVATKNENRESIQYSKNGSVLYDKQYKLEHGKIGDITTLYTIPGRGVAKEIVGEDSVTRSATRTIDYGKGDLVEQRFEFEKEYDANGHTYGYFSDKGTSTDYRPEYIYERKNDGHEASFTLKENGRAKFSISQGEDGTVVHQFDDKGEVIEDYHYDKDGNPTDKAMYVGDDRKAHIGPKRFKGIVTFPKDFINDELLMGQLDLSTLKEIQYNGFESLRDEFNMVIPEEVRKSLDDEDFEKGTPIKKGHSRDTEKDNGREY